MAYPTNPNVDYRERFIQLPKELQAFLTVETTWDSIQRLAEKYGFQGDASRMGILSDLLCDFTMQVISAEDFVRELSAFNVPAVQQEELRKDIVHNIFGAYRSAFQAEGIPYEKILTAKPTGAPPAVTAPPAPYRAEGPGAGQPIPRPPAPSAPAPAPYRAEGSGAGQPIPRPPAPSAPAPAPYRAEGSGAGPAAPPPKVVAPPPLTPKIPEELRAKQQVETTGPTAILEELGEIKKEKPAIPLTPTEFQPKPAPSGPLPKITMPAPYRAEGSGAGPAPQEKPSEMPPRPEVRFSVPPPSKFPGLSQEPKQPEISGRIITPGPYRAEGSGAGPGTPTQEPRVPGQIPPKPVSAPTPLTPTAPRVITPETKPGPEEPKKEVIDLSTFQIKDRGGETTSKPGLPPERHPPLPKPEPPKAGGNILDLSEQQ